MSSHIWRTEKFENHWWNLWKIWNHCFFHSQKLQDLTSTKKKRVGNFIYTFFNLRFLKFFQKLIEKTSNTERLTDLRRHIWKKNWHILWVLWWVDRSMASSKDRSMDLRRMKGSEQSNFEGHICNPWEETISPPKGRKICNFVCIKKRDTYETESLHNHAYAGHICNCWK